MVDDIAVDALYLVWGFWLCGLGTCALLDTPLALPGILFFTGFWSWSAKEVFL